MDLIKVKSARITFFLTLFVFLSLTRVAGAEEEHIDASHGNRAWANTSYVEPMEICGGNTPCYSGIQGAIEGASGSTLIRVAGGAYFQDIVIDKNVAIELGWDSDFSASGGIDPVDVRGGVEQDLGLVPYSQAPKTWTVDIPPNFSKVETGCYSSGQDGLNKYGGWNAYLKVNGQYAWKFVRFNPTDGGVIYDYIQDREVLESSGKGACLDVTSLAVAGENTITYYHYTGGDGIGIKVKTSSGGASPFGAAWTTDESAALAADSDGETMLVKSDAVVWTAANGQSFVIHYGSDGLPVKAVIDEHVLLYRNWTGNGHDLAIIAPDGTITIHRSVSVDPSVISELTAAHSSIPWASTHEGARAFDLSGSNLAEATRFGGYLLSAGVCGASIGTALGSAGLLTDVPFKKLIKVRGNHLNLFFIFSFLSTWP